MTSPVVVFIHGGFWRGQYTKVRMIGPASSSRPPGGRDGVEHRIPPTRHSPSAKPTSSALPGRDG